MPLPAAARINNWLPAQYVFAPPAPSATLASSDARAPDGMDKVNWISFQLENLRRPAQLCPAATTEAPTAPTELLGTSAEDLNSLDQIEDLRNLDADERALYENMVHTAIKSAQALIRV